MEAGSASGAHAMQVAPSCQVVVSAPEATTRQQPQEQQQQQQQRQQQQRQEQQQEQQRKRPPGMASAASGALSGIAIGALLQPLDVVRTRMQGESALGMPRRSVTTTALDILRTNGALSLWKGSAPAVLRMGLGVGLHMVLIEAMSEALRRPMRPAIDRLPQGAVADIGVGQAAGGGAGQARLSSVNAALAGALARAVASTILCPVTVIKTRMEYTGSGAIGYSSTIQALTMIARTEGARGLFRGVVPTVLTTAPFSGLYYAFYTRLKEQLAAEGRPQYVVNFCSGSLAAVAATVATQPFDVIRTRMQLTRANAAAGGSVQGYVATLHSALQQGPGTLFIGTLPRLLKRSGQTALVWTLYEELLPRLTMAYSSASALITPGSTSARS